MFATSDPVAAPPVRARHLRKVGPWPQPADTNISPARTELWLPRSALASCVRGVVARDTRGVPLRASERCNHLPATPFCTLLWHLHGECELGESAAAFEGERPRVAALCVCGPSSRPTITRNPGEVHAFMVLLMPDALRALTGLDAAALIDRVVPATEVLDPSWQRLLAEVQAAGDDDARVDLVEAFVLPRWQRTRPPAALRSPGLVDWSRDLALRVAPAGRDCSARQRQRRIRHWSGQSARDLQRLRRSEQAFFNAVHALRITGASNWSGVAAESGYADQSHLSRECRRVTGFAPDELRRRMRSDECLWLYRLWASSAGPAVVRPAHASVEVGVQSAG